MLRAVIVGRLPIVYHRFGKLGSNRPREPLMTRFLMTRFLVSGENPTGFKLEDILIAIRKDILRRCTKIADDHRSKHIR